jgi:hypothetical protein
MPAAVWSAPSPSPPPGRVPGPARGGLGRGARWALGLSVAGVLLLTAMTAGAVAAGQAVRGRDCLVPAFETPFGCADGRLTAEATATVSWVYPGGAVIDTYVDLEYPVAGETVSANDVLWPREAPQVRTGDTVRVAYDPDDPGFSVTSAAALAAKRTREAAGTGSAVAPALLWTSGLALLAACAALAGTVFWARRAPRPAPAAAPGWYAAPGYGHGYPPPYGYRPPPYGYPPPTYPPPQPPAQQPAPPVWPRPPEAPPPAAPPPAAPPPAGPWNAPG